MRTKVNSFFQKFYTRKCVRNVNRMSQVHNFLRKHWKPPYKLLKYILLICLISGHINAVNTQTENNEDSDSDDIVVRTESTPFSIKFFIDDDNYELLNVTCKNVKTLGHHDAQESECKDLSPCSKYLATIKIKNETVEEITKLMDVSTLYAEPTTELDKPISYQESVYISWKSTNPTCISEYIANVTDNKYTYIFAYQSDAYENNITSLIPCQVYYIKLETYDVYKVLISTKLDTTETLYAEPGDISITIEEVSNTQMKIKWIPPQYSSCIDFYYIKWYLKDCEAINQDNTTKEQEKFFIEDSSSSEINEQSTVGTTNAPTIETTLLPTVPPTVEADACVSTAKITNNEATEYTMNELKGCEDYGLEIYINTNKTEKSNSHDFMSPEQVPGLVTVSDPLLSASEVTLKWSQPVDNKKCIDFYKINITGPMQKPAAEQTTNETRTTDRFQTDATFVNLFPCGHYEYSIIGVSLSGNNGASMNSSFDTNESKPTPVRNYRVSEDAHNITISWDPPDYAELCLNGYRLSGWRDNNNPSPEFDKVTNDTIVLIEDLNACQTYTVQIIPMTKSMNDGELLQIEMETKPIIAQAPKDFQAISQYPNSLELSAQASDFNNNCETIFARFTCEANNKNVLHKKAERYVERGQVGDISFKALLEPLSPFTDYKCTVSLFNIAGWSANGTTIEKTEPYFPDPPQSIGTKASSKTSINFNWQAPKYANGNIKLYISYFQRVEAAYFVPRSCSPIANAAMSRETAGMEQSFTGLQPYIWYSIQVAAQNEYGVGEYSMPYMMKTEPSTSEPVTSLKIVPQGPYESVSEYKGNVVVSWTSPCKSNGVIDAFLIDFVGDRKGYPRQHLERRVEPSYNEYGHVSYNETELKPEFNYTVTMTVRTVDVEQESVSIIGTFDAPSGIPEPLNELVVAKATVDAYAASNPTHSAKVRFPAEILESESGNIVYIALLLSQKNCDIEPQLRYGALDAYLEWPDTQTWNQVYNDDTADCIRQYQSTPKHWYPNRAETNADDDIDSKDARNAEFIEYVLGTEKCATAVGYCNGPLKADTEYYLVIRLFTKSGYNDAATLQFKTDSLIQLTVILISVISCLLLAFVVGFVYLWITKRIVWKRESLHGIEDSFGDTIGKNFAIFYRDVSKPEKINREFKELTVVAMDLSYTASELGCNKNRYADIFPYDKNRVILDIDAEGSDYINASFIDGYRRKKEYIATQGPKPESSMDFWRMIHQHNVRVIVMVTQFREGDLVKCHEYFPFNSKTIDVTVKKKECFEIYDRTEMCLTHAQYGLRQKVLHFYFKKWPDHGCPTDPNHLITFVRKVKAEKVPSYSPIVVHCSAGVGRTGTFIGLDIIMQRLRNENKINIYEVVKKLRFQRMKMVQTLAQYTFLYACAYELVKHKRTRAALKYQKSNNKKVSFEDDLENNVNTLPPAPPLKFNGRRNNLDLSSVNELDFSDDSNTVGGSKQVEASNYGSLPIRFNGFHHKGGLESYDAYLDNDMDSAKERNTESDL